VSTTIYTHFISYIKICNIQQLFYVKNIPIVNNKAVANVRPKRDIDIS